MCINARHNAIYFPFLFCKCISGRWEIREEERGKGSFAIHGREGIDTYLCVAPGLKYSVLQKKITEIYISKEIFNAGIYTKIVAL